MEWVGPGGITDAAWGTLTRACSAGMESPEDAERETYQTAVAALRERLDAGSKTMAAQDFSKRKEQLQGMLQEPTLLDPDQKKQLYDFLATHHEAVWTRTTEERSTV